MDLISTLHKDYSDLSTCVNSLLICPSFPDIDECKDPEKYPCHGLCFNTQGNYTCKCKKGYSGDAKIQGGCQRKPFQTLLFSLGNPTYTPPSKRTLHI